MRFVCPNIDVEYLNEAVTCFVGQGPRLLISRDNKTWENTVLSNSLN